MGTTPRDVSSSDVNKLNRCYDDVCIMRGLLFSFHLTEQTAATSSTTISPLTKEETITAQNSPFLDEDSTLAP